MRKIKAKGIQLQHIAESGARNKLATKTANHASPTITDINQFDCQIQTPTFFEESRVSCLALRKHRLDVDAHLAARRVPAADDAEAQTLLAGPFAELDAEYGEGGVLH